MNRWFFKWGHEHQISINTHFYLCATCRNATTSSMHAISPILIKSSYNSEYPILFVSDSLRTGPSNVITKISIDTHFFNVPYAEMQPLLQRTQSINKKIQFWIFSTIWWTADFLSEYRTSKYQLTHIFFLKCASCKNAATSSTQAISPILINTRTFPIASPAIAKNNRKESDDREQQSPCQVTAFFFL